MPSQRVPESIAEKKEALDWIDRYADGVLSRAFSHFAAKKGWKISAAQIRYWYKNREAIRQASSDLLRLRGAGARPRLGEIEDMLFDEIVYRRSEHHKVSRQ
ncbi:hypothetical protein GN958_ATG14353 [Phytophthora infestans]|uniref:HTH CENPB-type domain-containing protein n=1 Tax=Phytophthora infestans TaxID=4787 RepID=A0A8S9UDP9_PHYIN|nr:hypothetical protein GN958_ATG14483 [Phytophthora infestans]KAF4136458.1 hypothetical protein GN958_ATG14353 [Phytophthora infestans]